MRFKAFHNYMFLKIVQQLNFLAMFIGIVALFFSPWYYTLACIISIIFISKIGHSIGQHRFFCHRAFKTGKILEKLIAILATLSTTSSIIYYSSIHRYHHANSDNDLDVHDPRKLGFFNTFFLFISPNSLEKIPKGIIKDLVRNKIVMFCHNWYWPIILTYILILALINPMLILFCYCIPSGYSQLMAGVQLTYGHGSGYQNFNTGDNSTNNIILNWLTLGEGLHNNHHARQNEYRFDFTRKKYEIDLTGILIEKLLKIK